MAFETTLTTMIIFFFILAVGFVAGKLGIIKQEFMGSFSQMITKIFLPALIFYSTTSSTTRQMVFENYWILILAAGFYFLIAVVTWSLARIMRIPHDKDRIFQFAFIFGNTAFVGMPLLAAVFPDYGLFFMCLFSIVDQLLFWTFGIWLSTARDRQTARFNPKKLLTPNIIAILLALAFVLLDILLPSIINNALGTISKATGALCMLYLGAMICFSEFGTVLKRAEVYVGIAVKMVLLPIAVGLLLMQTPLPYEMVASMTLVMALPVMTVVPMIASANGHEGDYATGIAVVSFIACVVTIPLVAFVVL